ncbi:MAG TPA: Asp23/Gls24 family envelope stress response protein [Thermaerobacter sp.]
MVRPTYSSLGRFYITRHVVAAIASHAARQVPGLAQVLRVGVDDREDGVVISLEVAVEYGRPLRPVLEAVQRRAAQAVEHMTALNVLAVDVVARRLVLPGGREGTGVPTPLPGAPPGEGQAAPTEREARQGGITARERAGN